MWFPMNNRKVTKSNSHSMIPNFFVNKIPPNRCRSTPSTAVARSRPDDPLPVGMKTVGNSIYLVISF
jgi:hypothetical protein